MTKIYRCQCAWHVPSCRQSILTSWCCVVVVVVVVVVFVVVGVGVVVVAAAAVVVVAVGCCYKGFADYFRYRGQQGHHWNSLGRASILSPIIVPEQGSKGAREVNCLRVKFSTPLAKKKSWLGTNHRLNIFRFEHVWKAFKAIASHSPSGRSAITQVFTGHVWSLWYHCNWYPSFQPPVLQFHLC